MSELKAYKIGDYRYEESSSCMHGFILYPGTIKSKTDGDLHYISYKQLLRLYQIPPHLVINGSNLNSLRGIIRGNYFHMFPDNDGVYQLTNEEKMFIEKHKT